MSVSASFLAALPSSLTVGCDVRSAAFAGLYEPPKELVCTLPFAKVRRKTLSICFAKQVAFLLRTRKTTLNQGLCLSLLVMTPSVDSLLLVSILERKVNFRVYVHRVVERDVS